MSESVEHHSHESHSGSEKARTSLNVVGDYVGGVRKGVRKIFEGAGVDVLWGTVKLPFQIVDQAVTDVWNITKATGRGIKKSVKWLVSPAKKGKSTEGGHH